MNRELKIYVTQFVFIGILFCSCIEENEYIIPETTSEQSTILPNSNLNALKTAYLQSGEEIYTFKDSVTLIEAYVISTDEGGNFYKTLVIQDKAVDPNSGIEVLINLKAYFTKFDIGRKIYLKIQGLSITGTNGKFQLGFLFGNQLKPIPEPLIDEFIVRTIHKEKINAKPISISDFSNDMLDMFVEIKNVQFRKDEIDRTYAGEIFDEFDGERILVQCNNLLTTTLSTSTFSRFKSLILPSSKMTVRAVLTKDFYSENYVLILNNISDTRFFEGERCDPKYLSCEGKIMEDANTIFFEDFESIKKTKEIENLGWVNHSVYFGAEKFEKRSSNGNNSMRISAYNSNESSMDVWLITPKISLEGTNEETLEFISIASYDNGTNLTTWVSSNFDGIIKEAKWQQLDVKIAKGPRNGYGSDYLNSGIVNLGCLEGKVNIAFRYIGGDPGISTTYEIDNVKVLGK